VDFAASDIVPLIIPRKTKGPLETISLGLQIKEIKRAIVCDCDHKINVDSLFEKIIDTQFQRTTIPVWEIEESESKNWSKIVIDDTKIINIVEKEEVDFEKYSIWGILGCIYFPNMDYFSNTIGVYVSDVCRSILEAEDNLLFAVINQAYFFGDTDMLEKCVNQRRNECSIFFDIDGVLLKHSDHSSNNLKQNLPLRDNIQTLKDLKSKNHKIILTTARSNKYRDGLELLLQKMQIPYDVLVTGLASGPRILINDRKPSKPFTVQANAIENYRNEPLSFDIDKIIGKNEEVIEKDLSANSGANTYLIRSKDEKFIRKVVKKSTSDFEKHIGVLKRQFFDLQRFNLMMPESCPKTLASHENNIEYYFDIEYLENYQKLNAYSRKIQETVLRRVLDDLKENVYCYSKQLTESERKAYFNQFIQDKIIKKLNIFSSQNELMKRLISGDFVKINGKNYKTLKEIFNNKGLMKFAPYTLSPVHGDLTLENILYNIIHDDYKLIDMDGAKLMDTHYLDFGKISQSILAHYKEWNDFDISVQFQEDGFTCNSDWFALKRKDMQFLTNLWPTCSDLEQIAIFYMSTYFIRFTPFRLKKGINHGLFALIMAVVWLNKLNLGDFGDLK